MDSLYAVRLSSGIVSVGVLISALEDWRNRAEFADGGLMAWPVVALGEEPQDRNWFLAQQVLFFNTKPALF